MLGVHLFLGRNLKVQMTVSDPFMTGLLTIGSALHQAIDFKTQVKLCKQLQLSTNNLQVKGDNDLCRVNNALLAGCQRWSAKPVVNLIKSTQRRRFSAFKTGLFTLKISCFPAELTHQLSDEDR